MSAVDVEVQHAEALLKAGALQRAIFNSANFSSIATDAKGVIQIFNVGAERMLGYAAADVMNKITPADISDPQEVIARATALSLELGTPITPGFEALVFKASRGIEDIYELTYIRKDGSRFPAVVSVTALRDAQDTIIGYLLIGTDNTARRQVEEERMKLDQRLRDQHFYTRSLIESNIDPLMATDPRGIITDVNKQTEALTGCTRDELIGAPFKDYFTDSARAEAAISRVLTEGKVTNYELTARARDGKLTVVSYNATTFHDRDRVLQGVFAAARDVTELKRFEHTLQQKNAQLEEASQFNSEFLANMSHELRTPLNSSLILAKLLADNRNGNLSDEQVKFAETIYAAGNDLLALINDILDLSKIESGKMEVHAATVTLERIRGTLKRTFEPVANEKGLRFIVTIAPSTPVAIETDAQRLEQILKNLLANALKFTERGEVVLDVAGSGDRITFAVRDTGIGIPKGQQEVIFEAFRQADGTTNRKFGGTGLGLSISRELARLLDGDISVTSEAGLGSTFTLSLPRIYSPTTYTERASQPSIMAPPEPAPPYVEAALPNDVAPQTEELEPGRPVVLVVEDDDPFALILTAVAREIGLQSLVATTAEQGYRFAVKHTPIGIVLDMKLPDHTGLYVLDRLKRDPATRHIPVHIISAYDYVETALSMGAASYLMKPVKREQLIEAFQVLEAKSAPRLRRVLVVEGDAGLRDTIANSLVGSNVAITTAASASDALALLAEQTFDCVVTDLSQDAFADAFPKKSGYELLEAMAEQEPYSLPPLIVYRALASDEEQRLRKYAGSLIITVARSPARLLEEVTLFLHQAESTLPPEQQQLLKQARRRGDVFEGRSILVVEDDVRNVFALTSVLEPMGVRVTIARNGREALTALEKEPHVDLVLMDLMMPEMDGLEATREIRKNAQWAKLPIIALTAKAMRDDQERCMAAGANDYLAKPLDVERLFSLLRVWMRTP